MQLWDSNAQPLCVKNVRLIDVKCPYLYRHRLNDWLKCSVTFLIYNNNNAKTTHLTSSPLKWYVPNNVIFMFTSRIYLFQTTHIGM